MYNEYNNMDSVDLMDIVKNMDYKGNDIHYYTGICKNEVFISLADVLDIISHNKRTELLDTEKVLIKAGVIPEYIKNMRPYFIESYINNQCVIYTAVIKVCEYYGEKDLQIFINNAVKMINEIGFYVEGLRYNYTNRKKNREPNVSDLLRMSDIEKYYNNSKILNWGYRVENIYQDVVDMISNLVFDTDIANLRYDRNINYDEKVSDFVTDREFNQLSIVSKIFSYMLSCNYDLSLEYIEFLASKVLETKCSKPKDANIVTGEFEYEDDESDPYKNVFKRIDDRYDDDYPDIDDFINHM